MAQFTKKAIIATFLELLETRSLDKITITDITERCEINRKTFYYYYEDLYDLIEDIFRIETQKVLDDTKECASFYEEFKRAIMLLFEYKKAIAHAFNSKSKDIVEQYLQKVTARFIKRYVEQYAQEVNATEKEIQFACNYYCCSIIATTLDWIKNGTQEESEAFVRTMSELFERTVRIVLQVSQQTK
ncbi:MAG: TetR/AcrR family transcriptional regulator C-terminal domain-containing protein [Lachnospiraceae bacterium]